MVQFYHEMMGVGASDPRRGGNNSMDSAAPFRDASNIWLPQKISFLIICCQTYAMPIKLKKICLVKKFFCKVFFSFQTKKVLKWHVSQKIISCIVPPAKQGMCVCSAQYKYTSSNTFSRPSACNYPWFSFVPRGNGVWGSIEKKVDLRPWLLFYLTSLAAATNAWWLPFFYFSVSGEMAYFLSMSKFSVRICVHSALFWGRVLVLTYISGLPNTLFPPR